MERCEREEKFGVVKRKENKTSSSDLVHIPGSIHSMTTGQKLGRSSQGLIVNCESE